MGILFRLRFRTQRPGRQESRSTPDPRRRQGYSSEFGCSQSFNEMGAKSELFVSFLHQATRVAKSAVLRLECFVMRIQISARPVSVSVFFFLLFTSHVLKCRSGRTVLPSTLSLSGARFEEGWLSSHPARYYYAVGIYLAEYPIPQRCVVR